MGGRSFAASACYDGMVPVVTLPDARAAGPGPATDRVLSEWLDAPVS